MKTTAQTNPNPAAGRATTPTDSVLQFSPRTRPHCRVSFACPLCGGEATLAGKDREFVCLDCTAFTTRTDD